MAAYTGAKGGDFFGLKSTFPDLKQLTDQLKVFGPRLADKYLASAMKKSSQPALAALRSITPKGPTGNLRRAIASKVVVYRKSGTGVLIVGYTKAGTGKATSTGGKVMKGKDRAFHAGFLEFGTKERTIKKDKVSGYKRRPHARKTKSGAYVGVVGHQVGGSGGGIASSFNTLGKFTFKAGGVRGRVQTNPKYPKAFFMRSSKGQLPRLGRTPALAPVATAYGMSEGAMKSLLSKNLADAVVNASREVAYLMSRAA